MNQSLRPNMLPDAFHSIGYLVKILSEHSSFILEMPLETRINTSEPFSSAPLLAEISFFHSYFSFCLLLSPTGRQDEIPAKQPRTPGPHIFIKKVS